jgi:predicted DNA-binding transcriptional regulator AlpA
MKDEDVYLTAAQVRNRYGGMSDMCLWRWLRDERLNFPRPLIINGRRYWRLRELIGWKRARAANTMEAA